MDLEQMIEEADRQYDAAVAAGNQEQADLIAADIREMLSMVDQPARDTGLLSSEGPIGQTAGAFTRGVANVAGAPVDLMTALINSPQSLSNLIGEGVNRLTGEETMRTDYPNFIPPERAVGGSNWLKEMLAKDIPDIPLPYTDAEIPMGPLAPADTGEYPFLSKSGEYAGTALATLLSLGAGGAMRAGQAGTGVADDLMRTALNDLTRRPATAIGAEMVAAPAAVAGGMVGGDLGATLAPQLGFDEEAGRRVGELVGELGGGLGGVTLGYGTGEVGRRYFADEMTPERYMALDRLGIEKSPGALSPALAGPIENTLATTPFAGAGMKQTQANQIDQWGDAASDMTAGMREGAGGTTPPRDTAQAGERIRAEGYEALDRLDARLADLSEQIYASIGGEGGPIPLARIVDEVQSMRSTMDATGAQAADLRVSDLVATPGATPIDANLDAQLRTRLASEQQEGLDTTQTVYQIARNLQIRNDQLERWRRRLGRTFEGRPGVDADLSGATYRALRDEQRSTAAASEDPEALATFEGSVEEQRRLIDKEQPLETGADQPFLENLTTQGGRERSAGTVYDFLTSNQAPERIIAFRRNTSPEKFEATMGDMIDLMGRNPSRKGASSDTNWDPGYFNKNWENLPQKTKDAIFSQADIEQRIDDLTLAARAFEQRGATGVTSSTFDRGIVASIFGSMVANPGLTIVALASANATGRFLLSDKAARALASQNPKYRDAIMALASRRVPAAAAVETSEELE